MKKKITCHLKGSKTKGWVITLCNPHHKFKWDQQLLNEEIPIIIDALNKVAKNKYAKK